MIVSVFLLLVAIAFFLTGLAIRGDVPQILGAAVAGIIGVITAVNALDLFVVTNSGNIKDIEPQIEVALILLVIFIINLIVIFDRAFSGGN
jgi:hypothetical protein